MTSTTLTPTVKVGLEGKHISHAVAIPSHNLMVFSCDMDPRILVFKNDAGGKLIHAFKKHHPHTSWVHIVGLFDDVLCSMDNKGNLFTWHASSGIVLGSCRLGGKPYPTIRKLNDAELVVSFGDRTVSILSHANGCNIEQVREIIVSDIDMITGIDVDGNSIVAVGKNMRAEVWDSTTGVKTASFGIARRVHLVKISDDYIFCGRDRDGTIERHANDGVYGLLQSVDLRQYFVQQGKEDADIYNFMVISSNLIMVVCCEGIVFVAFPSRKIIACSEFGNGELIYTGTILQDGRIYAAGSNGYCATFQAPEIIREDLKRFADKMYGEPGATTAVSSRRASSKEVERVSGLRKRGRQEYERGNESAQVSDMNVKVKRLEEAMKNMENNFKAERDDQIKRMMDMKLELEDQEREILELKLKQAEDEDNMQKIRKDEKDKMKKMNLERQREKADMKKVKEEFEIQKEKAKKLEQELKEKVTDMEREMRLELQFLKAAFLKN